MKTFTSTEKVPGGYYLNVRDWKLEAIDGASGTLPGGDAWRYVRVPVLGLLLVAPLLGLAFVVILPFFGFAVLVEGLWRRVQAAMAVRRIGEVRPTRVRR